MPAIEDLLVDAGVPAEYAALVAAVVAFVAAFAVVYLAGRTVVLPVVRRVLANRGVDAHARGPIEKAAWLAVLFAAVGAAFGAAGFRGFLQSLATIAAAATLAVGFALQDVIANFVAGVFIYTDRPFRVGDWIEWDDRAGVVEEVGLRVTRVRTFDNELLTVPNSELTGGVIKNPVASDRLRLRVDFGIGYDDDVERASEIVVAAAEDHPDVLDDPAPSVRLTELGDSAVVLQGRIWIPDPARSDVVSVRGEYAAAVKERFDEAGIDIPFPNRTIGGSLSVEQAPEVVDAGDGPGVTDD